MHYDRKRTKEKLNEFPDDMQVVIITNPTCSDWDVLCSVDELDYLEIDPKEYDAVDDKLKDTKKAILIQ